MEEIEEIEEIEKEQPILLGFKIYKSEKVYKDFEFLMDIFRERVFDNQSNLFRLLITTVAEQERKKRNNYVGLD